MKTVVHKSDARGYANHGWLKARHSFSFAQWYNPEKINFGVLRVLNDDIISGGQGFGTHPHDNMEIITIPLHGAIEHKDSEGNHGIINTGDLQIMSAGTGIRHSEFNHNKDQELNLLQIWLFPKVDNITPRYDQKTFKAEEQNNKFNVAVSPEKSDTSLWINQDAWFSLGKFEKGKAFTYTIKKKGNGAYVFLIEGKATVAGITLDKRDAIGISEADSFDFNVSDDAYILVIDLPMN